MKVSRSGYYDWLDRPKSSRSLENNELTKVIREVFTKSRNIYGTRRIADQLAKRGIFISRNRIVKLMALAVFPVKLSVNLRLQLIQSIISQYRLIYSTENLMLSKLILIGLAT